MSLSQSRPSQLVEKDNDIDFDHINDHLQLEN